MKLRLHVFFFRLSGKPIKHKHVKYEDKGVVRDIGAKSVFRVHSFALALTEIDTLCAHRDAPIITLQYLSCLDLIGFPGKP
jgi:hypothetical protein